MAIKHLNPWDIQTAYGLKPVFWEAREELARLGRQAAMMDSNPSRLRGREGEASMWTGFTQKLREAYVLLGRSTSVGHLILVLVELKKMVPMTDQQAYKQRLQSIIDIVKNTPVQQRLKEMK